jgi:hypothetical protein
MYAQSVAPESNATDRMTIPIIIVAVEAQSLWVAALVAADLAAEARSVAASEEVVLEAAALALAGKTNLQQREQQTKT